MLVQTRCTEWLSVYNFNPPLHGFLLVPGYQQAPVLLVQKLILQYADPIGNGSSNQTNQSRGWLIFTRRSIAW